MSLKANPSQKRSKGDLPAPKIRSPSAKRPAAYEHDSKEFIDLTGPTPAPSEPDAEKEAQVTEQIEGTVQEMLEVAESACKSGKSAELMGPTLLPDQTGAHIERSLGKHDFIAKKPLEGCGSTEFGSAHALARRPPRYMSLGDTYRTSLPGHLWGRRFEIQAWGQDLQPVAISLTFKAIMVCQGAHFTVFWSHGTENRLWKYNDALSAEIHIVVTSAREADMRTAASAGLPFLVLETDQGRYEEESQ
ncbi:hypothetical protein IWX48DRAFT_670559 [Phyllosticta citricarpa]